MRQYATTVISDHRFTVYWPESDADKNVWTVVIEKDGKELRREEIPMLYAPIFGADVGDVAALEARTEEIIKEMGLE